jgi:hypothetical protein
MSAEHKEEAGQALCDTLSKLAFMFADPQDEDAPPSEPKRALKVAVEFSGAKKGVLELMIPEPLCPEIAAGMLGCDPDDEQAVSASTDSLKELLNVVCGQLLPNIYGNDKLFDLGAPRIDEVNQAAWCELQRDEGTGRFQVDEHPLLVRLNVAA